MMLQPNVGVLAVVQARMSSTRMPGKVLTPLMGKPMILQQLERVQRSRLIDQIVVATSTEQSDDLLAATVTEAGYLCVRGSHDDVLERFVQVLEEHPAEVVARITADCPLISPEVIDRVIGDFLSGDYDYASNTLQPTYPDGLDVEVVRSDALRALAELGSDPDEREHVTLGIYRRPERFRLASVRDEQDGHSVNRSDLRWTVDVPEDFAFIERIYQHFLPEYPTFDYEDIVQLLEQRPDIAHTRPDLRRNAALDGLDTGAMQHPGGAA